MPPKRKFTISNSQKFNNNKITDLTKDHVSNSETQNKNSFSNEIFAQKQNNVEFGNLKNESSKANTDLDQKMSALISHYKTQEKDHTPKIKLFAYILLSLFLISLAAASYLLIVNINNTSPLHETSSPDNNSESTSSGREVDWDEIELEVLKKKHESDYEFENPDDTDESSDNEDNSDSENSAIYQEITAEIEALSQKVESLDELEVPEPSLYEF